MNSVRRRHPRLDATDIAILSEFQDNGRISKNELAFRVGISPPQCLRRLRALRERGIIEGVRALVDPKLLNYELVLFAMIQLHSQARCELDEFERFAGGQTIVRQSWLLSGDVDYLLKCAARDLADVRRFIAALTSLPNVRTIRTSLRWAMSSMPPLFRSDRRSVVAPVAARPLIL